MRTGNFLLLYLVAAVVLVAITGATEEFHRRTGSACMFCHRSSSGGSPGRPNLRPEGISFIKTLIEEEAYVPENRIRQLNLLVDKIAENKALRDGTASAEKLESQESAAETPETAVTEQASELADSETVTQDLATSDLVTEASSPMSAAVTAMTTASDSATPVVTTGLIPLSPALEQVEPGIRIKGSKTFIMKRDRGPVIPHSYLVGDDWEYDDYF